MGITRLLARYVMDRAAAPGGMMGPKYCIMDTIEKEDADIAVRYLPGIAGVRV